MFDYNLIDEYQIEVTTYCNAACPQGPRNVNGGKTNPYLPVCHLDRNVIDVSFPKSLVKRLRQVFFCGSYGDPIMHPEFLDILKDFRSKNPTLHLYLHTNGGVRNAEWWEEIAHVLGDHGKIDFGIDGLWDTNHLYRKNVEFSRVIENAKTFINAGGKAQWNYLVYKHNEHQISDARKMSEELGFDDILFRSTGRFMNHKTLTELEKWPVHNRDGEIEYYLEPPTDKEYHNSSVENLPKLHEEYPDIKDYFNETKIKCDALTGKKVAITAEGLVLPCNFFEHNLYDMRFHKRDVLPSSNDYHFDEDGNNQVMSLINRHNGDDQNLNIHSQPLYKIFESKFWEEIVWSWEQDIGCGKIFECAMTCGQKLSKVWDQNKKMKDTYRYYITGNNRGLGLDLAEHFNGDGCSRSTGQMLTDITTKVGIQRIVEQSLHYDVFINNAFDGPPDEPWGNFAQVNLLLAVFKAWKEENKSGYIFNIGSTGALSARVSHDRYAIAKDALATASRQCSKAFKDNLVKFKTTLITPGRLDTPLSRGRETWTGNGVKTLDICKFIEYTMGIENNSIIEDIIIDVNLEYGND